MKLSQRVLNGLGNKKVPPTKPKEKNVIDGVTRAAKKIRKKLGGGQLLSLSVRRKKIPMFLLIKMLKQKKLIQKIIWEIFW